ncbi:ABC transporter ATP-binding protein [Paenibacillus nasutitermitis]|uniref:ABC transporter ATP-binding protein n=1 Tax=Paenibacillus nasutitermitis TaxID=1652958 RepID=A0A916Z4S3_9BACL|nr:ABC transporter ATP-binding protein [Paenibacillus nasutitermitis]GGD76059.1 ABC transporter ATP-binding protein [Paenibacillus nasutitermitis]
MKDLLFYVNRLRLFAGRKLYINLISSVIISCLESVGIYLLVPMLSLIGIFSAGTSSIPFVSGFSEFIRWVPEKWSLLLILSIYALLIIGQAVMQKYQSIRSSEIQQGFIRLLRLDIYQALLESRWSFFVKKRRSDFNHVLTSELARVSQGTVQTMMLLTSLIFTVIQITFAFWLSAKLTALVIICGIGFVLFSRRFVKGAKVLGDRTSELSQSYFAGVNDHFNGIKDIKSNMLEKTNLNWFRSLCNRMEQNFIQFVRMQSSSQLLYKSSSAVLIVLFIFISFEVLHVRAEQLMLIILIFSRLWPRFTMIQNNLEQIVATFPAFKSLTDLQRDCQEAKEMALLERESQLKPFTIEEGITCHEVSFRYEGDKTGYALRNINFHIPANSTTAFVGKSGAGKSTLIDILIGLFQPESGQIVIDGVPLTPDNLFSYRNSISYVSQDPFLFNASIRENLMMVEPDATEAEIWEALKFSASDDFVSKLPQGMDTIIGDRGIRLSGGERQRIVLARAILRKPAILVLDEATSALDNENEAKIQGALDRLKGNMTIIVIAHRLSTIRNADQVIVLENGKIIQQGGYMQLSKETKGTFSQLLAYQTGSKA